MTTMRPSTPTKRVLRPDLAVGRPYVPGLVVRGPLVFVSGQTPVRNGRIVDGPIEDQAQAVFENIEAILRDAGASLADVVRCGVHLADLADLPRFNAAYEVAFAETLPARTTVGVDLPGYGVEVDCIAVLPDEESG
jgi:2-iminobutanoate/2-iminopropanoate deaminase